MFQIPQPEMRLRICDVEHGACALIQHCVGARGDRLAMIDAGCSADWRPSKHIKNVIGRSRLDYLFITNADQDHLSDINGLWSEGIVVPVIHHNPSVSSAAYRAMKMAAGALSSQAERFVSIHDTYTAAVDEPFNAHMNGITARMFWNPYPTFMDTNNLSLVVFIKFGLFQILFPGDLEQRGWQELLKNAEFRSELEDTTVLVASHHGRESGYCEEVFNYCKPRLVVMSDKSIIHDTQNMAGTYRQRVIDNYPSGAKVVTTNSNRHVLTTRRDGHIQFEVQGSTFSIFTGDLR